ncbi:tigger transposable element-derived protein 4-like [Oppia nitens]|uniref:tigger transposable element-derived protein 4-like n=1 Tax=Oppia nitens TaxID=1686743 RepID=UPI0023DAFA8E|nr:tigger transposable element-derived protein 4-like [Oppia nitens]
MAKSRKDLTFGNKSKLIIDYKNGLNQRQLQEKYKISIGAVNNIIKNTDYILSQTNKHKKRIRRTPNDKLNELVLKFVQLSNANKVPIDGPIIKVFASDIAIRLNLNQFKASDGWLSKFTKRHEIKYQSYSGESADINDKTVEQWIENLKDLLKDYNIEDIFNFDETGLFYKLLPKKSYLLKGVNKFGKKKFKQRVTLGLCCSSVGEKLKPVIIGTARKPRCFNNMKTSINSLGIHYYNNSSAWMTQTQNNRKILLFVDNCSAHKIPDDLNFSNIKIQYFPANTTSRLQPLDQGIIRSFKAKYRSYLIRHLTNNMHDLYQSTVNNNNIEFGTELKNMIKRFEIQTNSDTIVEEVVADSFETFQSCIGENLMTFEEIDNFEDSLQLHSNDFKNDLLEEAINDNIDNNDTDIEIMTSNELPLNDFVINNNSLTVNDGLEMVTKLETLIISELPELKKQSLKQTSITDYFK